jgi:hypothetical protein
MFIHNMMSKEEYSEAPNTLQNSNQQFLPVTLYKLYEISKHYRHTDIQVSVYGDKGAFFQWKNNRGEFAVNLYNFGTYVKTAEGKAKFVHINDHCMESRPQATVFSQYDDGIINIIFEDSINYYVMVLNMGQLRLKDNNAQIDIYDNRTMLEERRRTPDAFWTLFEKTFILFIQSRWAYDTEFPTNLYKPKFLIPYVQRDRTGVKNEIYYINYLLGLEEMLSKEWIIRFVSSITIAFRNVKENWEFTLPFGIDTYGKTIPYISQHRFNKYNQMEIIIVGKDNIDSQKMLEMVKINLFNNTIKFCDPLRALWCNLTSQSYKDRKLWQAVEHWYNVHNVNYIIYS